MDKEELWKGFGVGVLFLLTTGVAVGAPTWTIWVFNGHHSAWVYASAVGTGVVTLAGLLVIVTTIGMFLRES